MMITNKRRSCATPFFFLSIFIFLTAAFPKAQAQDFYDINTVNTISITFVESNWDQLLDDLYAAGEEERLVGTAVIKGVTYENVGVRYKGNSSYSPQNIKNPLNIKLDHLIEDQNLDGYGTLKLANVYKDPSFVREVVSYEIAGKYMPASQANFINVTINGTCMGLYTNVQSVDKFFLNNHFGSKSNSDISLEGYSLTDNSADIAQWTFPDVSIPAGGYLIVWADKDEDQEGLHTNFKLSASGETILLAGPDQTVIEEVTGSVYRRPFMY
ncbi:CotH kinase family protein [Desulfobacula sp.]|uniref:CotH kinase family protein n=1 Tax=Desulfobacula sp. TaxID=2593537 RepID=UPI00260C77AB|nr:CotH kinase family protein [Desulfobacula sp.]